MGFVVCRGVFRRPGGEVLSARAERNQRAAKGWAQSAGTALPPLPPCRPPPGPPFTGVTPWARQNISGAQNLSGWSKFPPGHWALGLHKFPLVRFHNCAWIYRANVPGAEYAVGAGVLTRPPGFQICFREAVGAAISHPSLPPPRGKVPSVCEADEGDLFTRIIHGGSPKGRPYPKLGRCP